MVRRLLAFCLVALLGTSGGPTAADSRLPLSSATDAAALADHVRQGDRARLLGRWADAAAAYAEALTIAERAGLPDDRRAVILGELGAAEVSLGKHRDGAGHLHRSLMHEGALTSEQKARYQKAQRKAVAEVAILVVAVNPSDAELLVNNEPIKERSSSHVLFVEPGQHTLRARLPGHIDGITRHNAPKGSEAAIALRLTEVPPLPAPTPPGPRVVVVSEPEGDRVARFRVPVLITAGGALVLGSGLLGGAVAVDDMVENQSADLIARGGSDTCTTGAYVAKCNRLGRHVDTRDGLAAVGRGALIVGAGLVVVGLGSFAFGPEKAKGGARVGVVPGGIVVEGEL